MSKSKQIEVPVSAMLEISKILENKEIENQILGPSDERDGAIVIEVTYDKEDRETIFELETAIEDAWDELDEDDDEQEDDEDEDDDEDK